MRIAKRFERKKKPSAACPATRTCRNARSAACTHAHSRVCVAGQEAKGTEIAEERELRAAQLRSPPAAEPGHPPPSPRAAKGRSRGERLEKSPVGQSPSQQREKSAAGSLQKATSATAGAAVHTSRRPTKKLKTLKVCAKRWKRKRSERTRGPLRLHNPEGEYAPNCWLRRQNAAPFSLERQLERQLIPLPREFDGRNLVRHDWWHRYGDLVGAKAHRDRLRSNRHFGRRPVVGPERHHNANATPQRLNSELDGRCVGALTWRNRRRGRGGRRGSRRGGRRRLGAGWRGASAARRRGKAPLGIA